MITGTYSSEQLTFFEVSQTVWSKSMGDPRYPDLHSSAENTSSTSVTDKLHGTFTWSFSLEIPREVVLVSKATRGEPRVYRPPESFSERHGRASVRYEICVRFVRGYFRSDDRWAFSRCDYAPADPRVQNTCGIWLYTIDHSGASFAIAPTCL